VPGSAVRAGLSLAWAAEAPPESSGDTRAILIALIGALGLLLVALIPVMVNLAKRDAGTTTPPAPAPGPEPSPGASEIQRIWDAIEGLRSGQATVGRELSGHDALLDECQRDVEDVEAAHERLRDEVHRHLWRDHGQDTRDAPRQR
jgi:hypothetical protein